MKTLSLSLAVVALLTVPSPLSSQSSTVEGRLTPPGRLAAEAVVYLIPQRSEDIRRPESHPFIDQVGLLFVPRILAVQAGTAVEFRNSDPILHNIFSPASPGAGFNLGTYPRTESRSHTFTEPGAHVILCHVHPEMYAFVIVVPTPHRTVVDGAGYFKIVDVPAGDYTLHVWHRLYRKFSRPVTVGRGTTVGLTLDLQRQGG
jgi:plastocyanin